MISSLSLSLSLFPSSGAVAEQKSRFGKKKEKEGRGATMAVTTCLMSGLPASQLALVECSPLNTARFAGLGFTYKF